METMDFDVVIVGGGPAGLACALHLKQLAAQTGREVSVCLVEKAAEMGAHTLSGAIMDMRALTELLPDWAEKNAPITTPVTQDRFVFLTEDGGHDLPHALLPACFHNTGHFIVRLGHVVKWLAAQAEALGVEIYPGFAAAHLLRNAQGAVTGVITGDQGVQKDGSPGPHHEPGMGLCGRYTLFAEGCRGHLGKALEAAFDLRTGVAPQAYGLGLKELWEVPAAQHQPGLALHSAGWPMDAQTYGGGFVYHLEAQQVAIGYVVGLDYTNPLLSPFDEFQRYKTHPHIRPFLEGGKRLAYGARAIVAGGLQSLPQLVFPGGALIGDDAGFLNAARIKGSHAAIKSGMLAAQATFDALCEGRSHDTLTAYPEQFKASWLYSELHQTRNFKPLMKRGLWWGSFLFGVDQMLLRGKAPWTLQRTQADHTTLMPADTAAEPAYPKPDGRLSFDRLSSVFLSNTHHEENQPCHLRLKDEGVPIHLNLARFRSPETRYCPAGVYEILRTTEGDPRLQINAQNCLHCKTCDIKDPGQNIDWTVPQGGEGPIYDGL